MKISDTGPEPHSIIKTVGTLYDAAAVGHVQGATVGHKFGFSGAAGTTKETIWDQGGLYSYLSAATILKLSSSDANDTAAGTGARTVHIYGLDGNYDEIDEVLPLNGQTAVNTAESYLRVYRMIVETAGSTGENEGDIYLGNGTVTAGVPADKYAKVLIGNNQTLMALYTVPRGKTLLIPRWYANVGQGKEATIDAVARDNANGAIFQVKQRRLLYQSALTMPQTIPFSFPEKWDLELRGFTATGTVAIAAGFDFVQIAEGD